MRVDPAKPDSSFRNATLESVHDHRINPFVDCILDLPQHARHAAWGQPAFEDRQLNTHPVFLAHLRDLPEALRTLSYRISDVVADQDIHGQSCHHERWIGWQVTPKMPCQQGRLNRGKRPSTDTASQDHVLQLRFLVALPLLDELFSSLIGQLHRPSGHLDEALRSNLPAADQRHYEPVGKRTKLLDQVQCERGSA